jgi:hypothetical protein
MSGLTPEFRRGMITGEMWDKRDGFVSLVTPDLHPVILKTRVTKDEARIQEWTSPLREPVASTRAELYLRNLRSGDYDLIGVIEGQWRGVAGEDFIVDMVLS